MRFGSLLLIVAPVAAVQPTLCALNGKSYCVITPPTPCPSNPLTKVGRFGCQIVDLRIAVSPGSGPPAMDYGLLARFIVPNKPAPGSGTPLLFRFHGTGSCGLGTPAAHESCECSPDIPCSLPDGCKDFQVAQEGVLVVRPAERGTIHCYEMNDPMTATATWLGRLEFEDYDTLLSAVLQGSLHPSLPGDVDAARVGVSGGSHGGIASFLYPVFSKHTTTGHKPFALAMPFEGTPDLASAWFGWE